MSSVGSSGSLTGKNHEFFVLVARSPDCSARLDDHDVRRGGREVRPAQAILAHAAQYAERRLVCDVHYRSDIVAGQQFGTVLALKLMQNPQFRSRMAAARAELEAMHPNSSALR